jgi:hypothetical protein
VLTKNNITAIWEVWTFLGNLTTYDNNGKIIRQWRRQSIVWLRARYKSYTKKGWKEIKSKSKEKELCLD